MYLQIKAEKGTKSTWRRSRYSLLIDLLLEVYSAHFVVPGEFITDWIKIPQ